MHRPPSRPLLANRKERMNRIECGFEVKFAPDDSMVFEGYGAVFKNIDAYGDVIAPGAFAQFLSDVNEGKAAWPAMLSQHGGLQLTASDMTPIGVWTEIVEDGHGLKVKGQFANTPRGQEMYQLMKMEPRPAIDGLSIGFIPKEWEPRSKPEDPKRTLKRIDLIEISPVTRPANTLARVASVKSVDEMESLSEIEAYLRDACGLSRKDAVTLVSRIKRLHQSDSGDGNQLAELLRAAPPI